MSEVTWRATKLRTKAGNLVVLPNAFISKEAIINYSEPAAPTRLEVEVGVSYGVPPNQVKAALAEAWRNAPLALAEPRRRTSLVADFGVVGGDLPRPVLDRTTTRRTPRRATRCGRPSTTR